MSSPRVVPAVVLRRHGDDPVSVALWSARVRNTRWSSGSHFVPLHGEKVCTWKNWNLSFWDELYSVLMNHLRRFNTDTHTHARMHTHTHAHTHACTHTHTAHSDTYAQTYAHKHTHTCAHTQTHTRKAYHLICSLSTMLSSHFGIHSTTTHTHTHTHWLPKCPSG
ncbi:unnamed protein product [Arctogadus glacialis]